MFVLSLFVERVFEECSHVLLTKLKQSGLSHAYNVVHDSMVCAHWRGTEIKELMLTWYKILAHAENHNCEKGLLLFQTINREEH